ncbi:MAG TPA: PEGA domain-containing protein [Gemmatimonadales bacterium]|nr:PEGA domain-containing protein [Gemmatimonadales bacterium]
MRCPRCALAELSETTQTCALCGYSSGSGGATPVVLGAPTELDARRELARDFRIEGLLESSPGEIAYSARDAEDRSLVLRVVPLTELGLPPDRVLASLEAAARLDHPHIIPVHDSGITEHFLWYATKHVEGRTVGAMELPACLRLLEQVANALEYARARGVTHGALRPECVLVDANELVLVSDFGTAGLVTSPETGGAAASDGAAADQRALAQLARQCLTGTSAGEGSTPLPPHVSQALQRATSARSADLFPSVLDFVAALRKEGKGGEGDGTTEAKATGEVADTRPNVALAWFSAKPRTRASGPKVISDTDADPAAAHWRRRVAAAAGVVLALGAGAAWLGLSSIPAAPAGNPVAAGPAAPPAAHAPPPPSLPQPAPVVPRIDTATAPTPAPALIRAPVPARAQPQPRRAGPAPPPPSAPRPARRPATRAPAPSATPVTTPLDVHAEPALVSVNAIPWGSVYVDGRPIGNTPQIDVALPPGTHRLRVERDGFRPYDRMIALAPGQRLRITDIALVER